MRSFLRFPLFLLPVLCILCFACTCSLWGGSSKTAQEETLERAAKQIEDVTGKLNLSIVWDRRLYSGEARQEFYRIFLVDNSLYAVIAETSRNENPASQPFKTVSFESMAQDYWLYSIDGGAGAIKWILPFDRDIPYPPIRDSLNASETLYVVCGNVIAAIDLTKKEGASLEPAWKKWQYPLATSISTGPCRTDGAIFVGGNDGRIYGVAKDERKDRLLMSSESTNGSIATTPLAVAGNPTKLFFASDDGNLYYQQGENRNLSEPILRVGKVVADLVMQQGARSTYLYVASTNSYLYSIDVPGVYADWMVNLGAPLVATPVVYQERLLLVTGTNELVLFDPDRARDRTSDPVMWRVGNVKKVLASGKKYIYVATADEKIASLDPSSGETVASVDAPDIDITVTNSGNARQAIYLGCSAGRIWSLQE